MTRKKKHVQCIEQKCKRSAAPRGNRCYACQKARFRAKHPMMAAFMNHRDNARRRGIVYGLTFEDFKKFAIRTDYINKKGRGNSGWHVDRIDERKGYFRGNIQALPGIENVMKRVRFDYEERQRGLGTGFKYLTTKEAPRATGTDDYPF